jgi:hypothetical protein
MVSYSTALWASPAVTTTSFGSGRSRQQMRRRVKHAVELQDGRRWNQLMTLCELPTDGMQQVPEEFAVSWPLATGEKDICPKCKAVANSA